MRLLTTVSTVHPSESSDSDKWEWTHPAHTSPIEGFLQSLHAWQNERRTNIVGNLYDITDETPRRIFSANLTDWQA